MTITLLTTMSSQDSSAKEEKVDELALDATQHVFRFVKAQIYGFLFSNQQTMKDLSVPREVSQVVIDGQVYTLGRTRSIMFVRSSKSERRLDRMHLLELRDASGQAYQFEIDLLQGCSTEGLTAVGRPKRLGAPARFPSATPFVRID